MKCNSLIPLRLCLASVVFLAIIGFGSDRAHGETADLAGKRTTALTGDAELARYLGGFYSESKDYKEAYFWYYFYYFHFLLCVRKVDYQESANAIKRVHAHKSMAREIQSVSETELNEVEKKAVALVLKIPAKKERR